MPTPPIIESVEDLYDRLDAIRADFDITPITVDACDRWSIQGGAIRHDTGGFFGVIGLRFEDDAERDSVLLYQPQSPITGLIVMEIDGEDHYLFQGRIEPGNPQVSQYSPTIQSTPANYLQMHGGKAVPYVDYFFSARSDADIITDSYQMDIGGRYLQKNKKVTFVRATAPVEAEPNCCWVPSRLMAQVAGESAMMNMDLRAMIGVMAWDESLLPKRDGGLGSAFHASLAAPTRPKVVGAIMSKVGRLTVERQRIAVDQLRGWDLTEWGLKERNAEQGFNVEYFKVRAPGREVVEWCQPLINSVSQGAVTQLCRIRDGSFELMVRLRNERGLSPGNALGPSDLIYPGLPLDQRQFDPANYAENQILSQTIENDEGGRFYNDTSECTVILSDGKEDLPEDAHWISLSELKLFTRMSNVCNIQLRYVASILLGIVKTP